MADLLQGLELPKKYYGDDIFVRWEGCDKHPLAKAEEAIEARRKVIELLRNSSGQRSSKRALAARLAKCRAGRRCLSGACPECIRAHQRWFTRTSWTAMEGRSEEFVSVTIVPTRWDVPGKETMTGDLETARKLISLVMRFAGAGVALGAIDLSFNERRGQLGSELKCAHAHLLVSKVGLPVWHRRLRMMLPSTPNVDRPLLVEPWDGNPKFINYTFRPNLSRRVSIDPVGDGREKDRANTRTPPLLNHQRVEAALMLDGFGLVNRIIHPGFRLDTNHKVPTFVRIED
ncbi:hypothetical protein LGR54_01740 [Ancylobacter sp. Lp-2]|uniref:hypothetical protein n=1 Tax=Ancylobacter sp. Lp-2 TaxID=2881339 RepID=UPI001E32AEC0|nr:hypothetical protein [Ancylobacter sp. Lp-2]MCB4767314.1 hypothetical protein [Ancylobacter sp. Lp-2]